MAEKPTDEEAQKVLDWIADLDPAWKERIAALQEERHVDAAGALGILSCYTLESGQHMNIPILEQLLDGFTPAGKTQVCTACGQEYTLAYPGQPYCGNVCADLARATQPDFVANAKMELQRAADELHTAAVKVAGGRPRVHPRP